MLFAPDVPPPGVELKLISFWRDRPKIDPRLQLVHTNAASQEGDIDSAYRWANQPGSGHTIPHIQFDRDGRAAMFLPSDRKGIANYRAADFSLGFETADTGYLADPGISALTLVQAEKVAVACAYYSMLHGIPLLYPDTWDGTGTACHTEPFGYPWWTNAKGKICPGAKKKQQVRELVLPRAREIVAAWTAPIPSPSPIPPTDPLSGVASMGAPLVLRYGGTPTTNWSGYYSFDGVARQGVRGLHHARQLQALGAIDAKTLQPVADPVWSDVTHTTNAEELDEWLTPGRD
jgi:hypothetical protein